MDTIVAPLEDVTLHLVIAVFGAEMDMSSQHHLDISLLLRELPRRSCGSAFGCHGYSSRALFHSMMARPTKNEGLRVWLFVECGLYMRKARNTNPKFSISLYLFIYSIFLFLKKKNKE